MCQHEPATSRYNCTPPNNSCALKLPSVLCPSDVAALRLQALSLTNNSEKQEVARCRGLDWRNRVFQDNLSASKPRTCMAHNAESAVKERYAAAAKTAE